MKSSIFRCPRCQTALRTFGSVELEKIVRCSQCGFIFAAPVSSSIRTKHPIDSDLELGLAPASWADWQPSNTSESAPPIEPPPMRARRQPFRVRRRRANFPWVNLIVGLTVGLAALGLLIISIVALWPSEKSEKLSSTGEKFVNTKDSPPGSEKLAKTKDSPSGWQEVISDEGRFRVLMPGTPTINDSVQHNSLGSMSLRAFDLDGPVCKFSV